MKKGETYKFNPEDFQGKRQDQVESSYKVIGWAMMMLVIYMVGFLAWNTLK
jgi:hypothetical protein